MLLSFCFKLAGEKVAQLCRKTKKKSLPIHNSKIHKT